MFMTPGLALGPRVPATSAPNPLLPSLRLHTGETSGTAEATTSATAFASRRRYIAPVLLSALVPGAGEIASGHWLRGVPLVVGDVVTWMAFSSYQQDGRDWRGRYERFADANWSYAFWQQNLRQHFNDPAQPPVWWDTTQAYNCNCPYIPKEKDRQHYYENIGKYHYYWMGWDDWQFNPDSPYDSDSRGLRRHYDDMRIESNHNFDLSTDMLFVAMGTRLLSVVQTIFLVRRDTEHERLSLQAVPLRGPGVELTMTFKY
jgi:hypothetical protein